MYSTFHNLRMQAYVRIPSLVPQTFGNLEFVRGNKVLASFLEQGDFDAVSANLNISEDADLQGLVKRSVIKTFGEDMVGIIGYGTEIINDIAVLGKKIIYRDQWLYKRVATLQVKLPCSRCPRKKKTIVIKEELKKKKTSAVQTNMTF